jgi:hypothetical protein
MPIVMFHQYYQSNVKVSKLQKRYGKLQRKLGELNLISDDPYCFEIILYLL